MDAPEGARAVVYETVAEALLIDPKLVNDELRAAAIPEWDSLGHLQVVSALEERFGLSFDDVDLFECESVGDFVRAIEPQQQPSGNEG